MFVVIILWTTLIELALTFPSGEKTWSSAICSNSVLCFSLATIISSDKTLLEGSHRLIITLALIYTQQL